MKPYIGLNTQKRPQAKQSFEKAYVQLTHISVIGKCMEHVRNYELTTKEQIAVTCVSKTHSRALAILTAYIW